MHPHPHDGHGHGHHHHVPAPGDATRTFAVITLVNLAYTAIEAGYGFLTGSLALLSDALHNLGDVLGLAMAWGAAVIAQWPPTERHTCAHAGIRALTETHLQLLRAARRKTFLQKILLDLAFARSPTLGRWLLQS